MTVKRRIITVRGDYGVIGEDTGFSAYYLPQWNQVIRVGDVVSFLFNDNVHTGVVMRDDNQYGVMGWGVDRLDYDRISIVIPHSKVTEEIIKTLHGDSFSIVEDIAEEMTIGEIEKELGRRIKIIDRTGRHQSMSRGDRGNCRQEGKNN